LGVRRPHKDQDLPLSAIGLDRLPVPRRQRILSLVDALGDLKALPQVTQRALSCIQDSRSSSTELSAIIATDQAISARLLGMANSAFGRGVRPFVSVQEAVVRLGYRNVQDVLLSIAASNLLEKPLPLYDVAPGELWRHSVATAISARLVALRCQVPQNNAAYVAGLMHDAGRFVLDRGLLPSEKSAIRGIVAHDRTSFQNAEYEVLGFSHAEVGAVLLHRWGLSEEVVHAVAVHHRPSLSIEEGLGAAIHAADVLALLALPISRPGWLFAVEPLISSRFGISPDSRVLPELLTEIKAGFDSAVRLVGR